jgi:hypothetical protein
MLQVRLAIRSVQAKPMVLEALLPKHKATTISEQGVSPQYYLTISGIAMSFGILESFYALVRSVQRFRAMVEGEHKTIV